MPSNSGRRTPPPSSIRNLKDWRVTRISYFFQTQILGNPRARVSRNISYCRHSPKTVPIPSKYRPNTVQIPSQYRPDSVPTPSRFRPIKNTKSQGRSKRRGLSQGADPRVGRGGGRGPRGPGGASRRQGLRPPPLPTLGSAPWLNPFLFDLRWLLILFW